MQSKKPTKDMPMKGKMPADMPPKKMPMPAPKKAGKKGC